MGRVDYSVSMGGGGKRPQRGVGGRWVAASQPLDAIPARVNADDRSDESCLALAHLRLADRLDVVQ